MKHQAFYEAAAQILSVLLLALVLEARLFRRDEEECGPRSSLRRDRNRAE